MSQEVHDIGLYIMHRVGKYIERTVPLSPIIPLNSWAPKEVDGQEIQDRLFHSTNNEFMEFTASECSDARRMGVLKLGLDRFMEEEEGSLYDEHIVF